MNSYVNQKGSQLNKRLTAVLAALTLILGVAGTATASPQAALPTAGKVPPRVTAGLGNVPDLIEVSDSNDDQMRVVGYARKADVFHPAATAKGVLAVYDRAGSKLVGRLYPNGSGFVPVGVTTIPPAKNKPVVLTSGATVASYTAGPETTFTDHLYSPGQSLHYCGAEQSQIGNGGTEHMAWGAAFTRPVLWYGVCNLGTAPTIDPGYLTVELTMIRSGQVCGQTEWVGNWSRTYILGIGAKPCSNPFGVQTWVTLGGHRIYDSACGCMHDGDSMSPSNSY